MEGMGESYGDFMHRAEEGESQSCSSIFKQTMSSNNGEKDNNRKTCSIAVPGQQGMNRHGIPQPHPTHLGPASPSLFQQGRSQSLYSQLPSSGTFSQTQRPSHCRSVSQPAFLTVDQSSSTPSSSVPEGQFFDRLPPISPASVHMPKRRGVPETTNLPSNSGSVDVSMESQNPLGHSRSGGSSSPSSGSAHCPAPLAQQFGSGNVPGLASRRGHRRTCSEVPYIFSQHSQGQMDQIIASGSGKEEDERQRMGEPHMETPGGKEGFNRDGDLNMEGVELGDSLYNSNYERDNVKSLGGGEAGTGNDEGRRQTLDGKERVCKGSETSDVVMRSADGSDGIHLRADSGGSVKEKNDKDVDWISSEDDADSEVNLMGNQSRNATSFEKGKEGNCHQSFGGGRHNRSVSMDSILSNNIHGLNSGKDLKLSPSRQNQSGRDFRRSSTDGNINLKMELSGEFTEAELKKILSNEKLTEIARTDPRRAKRILANRLSAARSKERKMLYMTELEGKVQTLQTEATTLSAQLTLLQRDLAGLANENSGLKLRLQGMEQQAQLQDALNKALMEEVQRLKLATGQPVKEQPTGLAHQISSSQLFQIQQHGLQHQQHLEDSVQSSGQIQNGTFQNSNYSYQQLMGSVKQDAQNICAGYGNNH